MTAMARPRTIHDFFGFPERLFQVDYPAPGAPDVAQEVAEVVKPSHAGLDRDSWGLDHGAWSVLVHMFPAADVPVVQLSINSLRSFDWHLELGARLAPLRQRGVLILGSGNVVHNLRLIDWRHPEEGFDWARRFDEAARELLAERPEAIASLQSHPDFARAVPTPEHFIPLLYLAGLAAAERRRTNVLVGGLAFGSLSMTCHGLDAECPPLQSAEPSAPIPDPQAIPPNETNT
jgi:4,5-DOPA dioxygenase extradiol